MKKQFKLDEIDCANCARELQDELAKLEGVKSVSVNFMTQKLTLEADDAEFEEVLDRRLKVMDLTAFTLCRENGLRIIVFDMDTAGNLGKVLAGEKIGTLVKL